MNSFQRRTSYLNKMFMALILLLMLLLGVSLTFINPAMANSNNLPDPVAQAVQKDASKRSNLPTEQLRIVDSVQRDWPDGCLGLAQPGTFCTQQVVSGWQVKVASGRETFIYRTNQSGSVVKLGS